MKPAVGYFASVAAVHVRVEVVLASEDFLAKMAASLLRFRGSGSGSGSDSDSGVVLPTSLISVIIRQQLFQLF